MPVLSQELANCEGGESHYGHYQERGHITLSLFKVLAGLGGLNLTVVAWLLPRVSCDRGRGGKR